MSIYENRPWKINFFCCQGIFVINFDLKNRRKNEFKDYKLYKLYHYEESCS